MATTPQQLLDDAKCYACGDSKMLQLMELALLAQIAGASISVSTFMRAGNYGGGEPDWIPAGGVGLAIDTSTTPGTQWTYHSGAWH